MKAIRERGGFVEFLVEDEIIEDYPDKVMALLSSVVVVRAENRFEHRAVLYTAWGPEFERVKPGVFPPRVGLSCVWQPFRTPDEETCWRELVSVSFGEQDEHGNMGFEVTLPTIVKEDDGA